ncbi:MAG: hypothetical protein LCI00_08230 [Chloroflexi bacterium]|nr:hypothetical protein [Chloroflexota bacterium]
MMEYDNQALHRSSAAVRRTASTPSANNGVLQTLVVQRSYSHLWRSLG